ncbi:winged helix-turn-helix transcriptional regulator [Thermoplasma volcanium]|nr:helix-turn-helix domain-containing protein [Thermoplasma volcanium]
MDESTCPIIEAIREVGKENDLLVIRLLSDNDLGFNQILKLAGKMSPKTLSVTLKRLTEKKIIYRDVVSTQPFRVKYRLTEKGQELRNVLNDLGQWGERWILNNESQSAVNTENYRLKS